MGSKVVFMGTPDFAVESLSQILKTEVEVVGVVTTPDRPAGRGQQLKTSAVKRFAQLKNLTILQPEKLKNSVFNEALEKLNADLFVVVAFRMLPKIVWRIPPKGTINLHGSLLPQYRGAAPINWAIINGDKKTGVTTFFIDEKIDTGRIIDRVEISISDDDSAGTLHDKLMIEGAKLLAKTVVRVLNGAVISTQQKEISVENLREAPKIFKSDCEIDWTQGSEKIYNKIRGLSPYPTAWTKIKKDIQKKSIKLFDSIKHFDGLNHSGKIKVEMNRLYFGTADGWIELLQLQLEGKKRMSVSDFLKGFKIQDWHL